MHNTATTTLILTPETLPEKQSQILDSHRGGTRELLDKLSDKQIQALTNLRTTCRTRTSNSPRLYSDLSNRQENTEELRRLKRKTCFENWDLSSEHYGQNDNTPKRGVPLWVQA